MRNKIFINSLLLVLASMTMHAQDTLKILHYTETTGYDHGTKMVSKQLFQRICDSLSLNNNTVWLLYHSDTSEVFDDPTFLQSFHVVIWSNTSGAGGLTITQQQNFEQYFLNGGNYLGIHAASDTYRHSSANGNNTGAWDFYAENLSGCSVQENPNHTSANFPGTILHTANHPTLNGLPNPWNKNEEYYYWENGFVESSFTNLLAVESTGMQSYDSSRMVARYKVHAWGSKSFYTSLGHDANDYVQDQTFELLLKNTLQWMQPPLLSNPEASTHPLAAITISPNPVNNTLTLHQLPEQGVEIQLYDATGKTVVTHFNKQNIYLEGLPAGLYFLSISYQNNVVSHPIIKE